MRRFSQTALLALCVSCASTSAQDKPAGQSDIDKLIKRGDVRALEARLGNSPDALAKIAEAARYRASRARKPLDKENLFADAEKRYLKVINAVQKSGGDPTKNKVDRTRGYLNLAGMVLSAWAGQDMTKFEISGGRYGDNKRLASKLRKARGYYEKARDLINPIFDERNQRANQFLAMDIYDTVKAYKLDTDFNLGFANLYLGMVLDRKSPERIASLRAAEDAFQELVDSIGAGEPKMYQCHLGLAVSMSEQKRYDAALRHFDLAMDEGADPIIKMQTQYEKARSLINNDKFLEARVVLEPLLAKDVARLKPEERDGAFYVNLAAIWEAYSYLRESRVFHRQALAAKVGKKALDVNARRAREKGLSKMRRLKSRGRDWPKVVSLWTKSSIREGQDPEKMTPTELTFAAEKWTSNKDFKKAILYLEAALQRHNVPADILVQIRFDLGLNHYRLFDLNMSDQPLRELRWAAEAFDTVAAKHKKHDKAATAIKFAYQCWGRLAKETKNPEDFAKLAATLGILLKNFPDHEERAKATWLLATAQQAAGQFGKALKRFAAVPADSPKWEEARFRIALCSRLACEAQRGELAPEAFLALARKSAATMREYADAAFKRAGGKKNVLGWAAQAYVGAAELLTARGVGRFQDALGALADFETRFPSSDLMGRVLAAQIKAHRGLNDFDKASSLLKKYMATVPKEQAGAVLAGLASGMQNEIVSMWETEQRDSARRMAADAISIFELLLSAVTANPKLASQKDAATFQLGRMLYFANDLERAQKLVTDLLAKSPKNGRYMQLNAQILTAGLAPDASPAALKVAEDAWAALLKNPSLRKNAPELFWEARYNWWEIQLRLGKAAEVANGIKQFGVWHAELGGPPWAQRLRDLMRRAAEKAGINLEAAPAPAASPKAEAGTTP